MGAVEELDQLVVVEPIGGNPVEAGEVDLGDVDGLGVDLGLGGNVQIGAEGGEVDPLAVELVGQLQHADGGAERDLGVAGFGGLERRAALQVGHRRRGPDLADEPDSLGGVKRGQGLAVDVFGRPPLGLHRQRGARDAAEDLRFRVRRRDRRAGDGDEPLRELVKPPVVERLQRQRVLLHDRPAHDLGDEVGGRRQGVAGGSGAVEEGESVFLGRFGVVGIGGGGPFVVDRGVGPEGGEQGAAVPEGPGELDLLDEVFLFRRRDELAERLQVDGLLGLARRGDVAAQRLGRGGPLSASQSRQRPRFRSATGTRSAESDSKPEAASVHWPRRALSIAFSKRSTSGGARPSGAGESS